MISLIFCKIGVIFDLAKLKTKNSQLKLLFSIGGETEGSQIFSSVAANKLKTKNMGESCVAYLRKYNFDGVDIDWEFPKASDKVRN